MPIKIAINGFGRIGRLVARAAIASSGKTGIELVSINDITNPAMLAHLFHYDSVHGRFEGDVSARTHERDANGAIGELTVNGKAIKVTAERDPAKLPHAAYGADIVVESTGRFTDCKKDPSARSHLKAGAKRVIISAPAKGEDATVCLGVNESVLTKDTVIVSNASCTTNCLAPVVKVLHEAYGVKRGLMTTIHSYTNDQRVLDLEHEDKRRARAAAINMIPTKTGAAAAIGLVMPELKGLLDGYAVRVPTANVSAVDLTLEVQRPAKDAAEVNGHFERAAADTKGVGRVLDYIADELVSSDFNHCPASASLDASLTRVLGGTFVKVFAWYDNEWGYSNRVVDLVSLMAKL